MMPVQLDSSRVGSNFHRLQKVYACSYGVDDIVPYQIEWGGQTHSDCIGARVEAIRFSSFVALSAVGGNICTVCTER